MTKWQLLEKIKKLEKQEESLRKTLERLKRKDLIKHFESLLLDVQCQLIQFENELIYC